MGISKPPKSCFSYDCTQLAGQKGEILSVLYPKERTHAEISGRRAAREYYRFFKDNVAGFENSQLIDMAAEGGVRQTRTFNGEKCLLNSDDVATIQNRSDKN